jgi:signal transduction histidine kinase
MQTDTHRAISRGDRSGSGGRDSDRPGLIELVSGAVSEAVVVLDRTCHVVHVNAAGQRLLGEHGSFDAGRLAAVCGHSIESVLDRVSDGPDSGLEVADRHGRRCRVEAHRVNGDGEIAALLIARELDAERRADDRGELGARLAAGVAHDLGNLLQGIGALAEAVCGRLDLAPRTRADLCTIVEQAAVGTRVVRQLLDLSRPTPASRHPIDLGQLLRDQWPVLDRVPAAVELELDVPAGRFPVLAAPALLQQLVTNLVLNARDAVPKGGRVRVSLDRVNGNPRQSPIPSKIRGGAWLELRVTDNGFGMPPHVRARAFEPFFTTKPRGTGSGLGLAQVRDIVEQHGGHVALDSRPGEGTSVAVFLPESGRTMDDRDTIAIR